MSFELPRVAILASGDIENGGGGSTAERVALDVLEGRANFTIGVVICNNGPESGVGVYEKFAKLNQRFGLTADNRIDVINISGKTHPGTRVEGGMTMAESNAIGETLKQRDIGFVAMLGYMKKVTGPFANQWLWQPQHAHHVRHAFDQGRYHPDARVLNNHPAILPFTAGEHGAGAHQKAIDLYRTGKLSHTAMTWHLAAHQIDAGPIVGSQLIEIFDNDTANSLGSRVQNAEKLMTSGVIEQHLILREQHLSNI